MYKYNVETQLKDFIFNINKLRDEGFGVDELASYAYRISPTKPASSPKLPKGKAVAITFMGITHGSELVGISVLNDLVKLITQRVVKLELPIQIILGNYKAALKNKRFLESDLNRSFAVTNINSWEHERANELMPVIRDSLLLLDLHQTGTKTLSPFFIFPYRKSSMAFARSIHHRIPVITHWGGGFSKDGMCTDEYLNSQNGIGITLELGLSGFDVYQSSLGVQCVSQALHSANLYAKTQEFPKVEALTSAVDESGDIMAFEHIEPWDGKTSPELVPGLYNFQNIKNGEILGNCQEGKILAPCDGRLMFPKYLKPGEKPPAEMYRVLRKVELSELPDVD